jgi:hypothetical protein
MSNYHLVDVEQHSFRAYSSYDVLDFSYNKLKILSNIFLSGKSVEIMKMRINNNLIETISYVFNYNYLRNNLLNEIPVSEYFYEDTLILDLRFNSIKTMKLMYSIIG